MEDELVGKIKHVYTDTNFTVVGSQSGKISKNALKWVLLVALSQGACIFFVQTQSGHRIGESFETLIFMNL